MHKTNDHADHLKGLVSTKSPLPQILVTKTGTCLGEGSLNHLTQPQEPLFKANLSVFRDTLE